MFLFSSPRCYTSQQKGEESVKDVQMHSCMRRGKTKRLHILSGRWSLQCRLTDIIDFLSAFRHLLLHCSTVDKDWCARLCKDPTWGELHQKERNTLGLGCLQTLIVPACLHTCSGFTARLVNPSQDFKHRAESFTCNLHSCLHTLPTTCSASRASVNYP